MSDVRRRARLVLVASAVVVAGTVTACGSHWWSSSQELDSPPPAEQVDSSDSGDGAEKREASPDRDPAAVAALIGTLDPCALVSLEDTAEASKAAGGDGLPDDAAVLPTRPQTCVVADPYPTPSAFLEVDVGVRFDHGDRYLAEPLVLAGHRAYRTWFTEGTCYVVAPISFTRGVKFTVDAGRSGNRGLGGDECEFASAAAEAGVKRLADSLAELQVDPTERAFTGWDPCLFLQTVVDAPPDQVDYEPSGLHGSACEALILLDGGLERIKFDVAYAAGPFLGGEPASIAGKDGTVSDTEHGCRVQWQDGASGLDHSYLVDVWFRFEQAEVGCDELSALAEASIAAAETAPPEASPPESAVYREDEPDTDAVGGCVHVAERDDCAPYQPTDVPAGGGKAILDAAEVERNVLCALTEAAVAESYAEVDFIPVTYGDSCVYVEASHTLILRVSYASHISAGSWMGPGLTPCEPGEEVAVAKLAAVRCNNAGHSQAPEHGIYVSPTDDLNAPGSLGFSARQGPPRGSGLTGLQESLEGDLDKLMLIENVAELVIEQHLG